MSLVPWASAGVSWEAGEDPRAPEPRVRQGQGSVLTHPVGPGPRCPACHPRVRGWPECMSHTATSLGTVVRGGQAGAGCLCLSSLASSSTQGAQATLEPFQAALSRAESQSWRPGEAAVPAEAGGGRRWSLLEGRWDRGPAPAPGRHRPWVLTEHPAHRAACRGLRTPVRLRSVPRHRCQEAACWALTLPGQESHSPLGSPGSPDCPVGHECATPGAWRRVGDLLVMSAACVGGDVVAWTEASKSRARLGAAAHMVTPDRDAGSTEPLHSADVLGEPALGACRALGATLCCRKGCGRVDVLQHLWQTGERSIDAGHTRAPGWAGAPWPAASATHPSVVSGCWGHRDHRVPVGPPWAVLTRPAQW